ncbi:alpha/beta-hydrolase [Dendrothele bispora CBS 962.96]|uniref:Alpha/beta-hydrolase n=1 Tax=Dendrothele bispora (strain CBS 962.96) TaxID=1314807 RepID=A0A4S8MXF2_DENBC|nr:alpha/beta-hydrolase [Dendrothele bispora CBS 962.96]
MDIPTSTMQLSGGIQIAYTILGSSLLGRVRPIVLVPGMSVVKHDWRRISVSLATRRPVLIYDLRGMGESTCSDAAIEDISIETLARDLLSLITHLGWSDIALCGWSLGGVIVQQLLVLPYHASRPTPLPFRVSHVFLISTRSVVLKPNQHRLQQIKPASGNRPRTLAERRVIVRDILKQAFDPAWLQANQVRFENIVDNHLPQSRPLPVIAKQQRAALTFDFEKLLPKIPRETKVGVIHGELDQMIPFSAGLDIIHRIPSARLLEQGHRPGQLPTYNFGHQWFDYFDDNLWVNVFEGFMKA